MRKLIVSVLSYPPFSTIKNNEIHGLFGAAYRYKLYFILDKMNYTLVPKDLSTSAHCSSESVCFGDLRQLQLGKIDFAGFFSQFQISSNVVNLTIGPAVMEDQCSILYSPTIRIDKSVQAVLSSFSKTFCFLLYSLLIHLILSAAIQNTIYVSSTFDQLDTLDDLASHGYSISLLFGPCNEVIKASQGSILGSHGLTSSLHSLVGMDKFQVADFFAHSILITEKYNMVRAKILVYQQTINGTKGRRMYQSAEPVFSLLQFPVLPNSLEPDLQEQLIRDVYSSFETGNMQNYRLYLPVMIALSDGPLCSECLEPLRKTREAITISIPYNHAELMLFYLGIAFAIGFIVFVIELLFKPKPSSNANSIFNPFRLSAAIY
uniref:Uncharacterized protein n=1 Tax=Tetranychus urticae TaxID=32264 RepID=T1KKJ8_TETUR